MEIWELRYEHERDVQAARCKSLGIKVPEEKEYGNLKRVPNLHLMPFNGPKVFQELNQLGHSALDFTSCVCQKVNIC